MHDARRKRKQSWISSTRTSRRCCSTGNPPLFLRTRKDRMICLVSASCTCLDVVLCIHLIVELRILGMLIKGMYEAMGWRTGMLSTVAHYVHGVNKLDSLNTTPDVVLVQNMMAKMLHNGAEAVVMEASSHGLALCRCDEVDIAIAVFINLTRDHLDFHVTEGEDRDARGKLFSRMVDPQRHRKVVNIDDPNAPFFISQVNPDVPVVTFAMENKNAGGYPLKFKLSLIETQV